MLNKTLCTVLVIGLAACATTPKQDVAAIEATLSALDTSALAYINLPLCGEQGASPLCSDPNIVLKIGTASSAAYTAVKAAETAESQDAINQAKTAIAAFSAIINTVTAR